jgi:NAD-dependent dihydropyrimidine dehydrogenase PreA subunit
MLDVLKTVFQTIFRLFPFSTKTGLRRIGHPGPDSPVFVTSNFDLTVRRVTRALQGLDCYLLVGDSKGINVWCAAGGGIFNAHSVISVLKTSRIAEKVNHRTLILPQLSAPGIDVTRVTRETGWHCKFGPVYAEDIPAYVVARFKKTEAMRRARFPLRERLEMAVMVAGPLSILAGIPVAIFSLQSLPGAMALIWSFALLLFAFYHQAMRTVPGSIGLAKTLALGLVGAAGVGAYGLTVGGWTLGAVVGWSLGILGVALALGFDLDGATPLNAGDTMVFWGRKWPVILDIFAKFGIGHEPYFTVQVDPDRCSGCKTCGEVCPKGVFEYYRLNGKLKSRAAGVAGCERCTACVKQCPNHAILADPPVRQFAYD